MPDAAAHRPSPAFAKHLRCLRDQCAAHVDAAAKSVTAAEGLLAVAHDRLAEEQAALADYDAVIAMLEQPDA